MLWKSDDLVHFRELGLLRLQKTGIIQQVRCEYDTDQKKYRIEWQDLEGDWKRAEETDIFSLDRITEYKKVQWPVVWTNEFHSGELRNIKGAKPGNCIHISEDHGKYLKEKLSAYQYVFRNESDKNRVQNRLYFPLFRNHEDPCCMYWNGKYYYIATNDLDGTNSFYIRCGDRMEDILTARKYLLLDNTMYPDMKNVLWAPEFHEINGELYIFYAATEGEFYREQSRIMKLKKGGNPMNSLDWLESKPVVRKDGSPLCEAGKEITLDMTAFYWQGKVYAAWSQRRFLPVDQGAWLYLAQIDEKEPWKLLSDPVCIARPEYGWENNRTFVVEGPYALEFEGKLMITYSGAGVDSAYTVGLLRLEESSMSYRDYPYELYKENRNGKECFSISFIDVNGEIYSRIKNNPLSVEDIVSEHLLQEEFESVVRHLPEKQRRRFLLHYEHGLTFASPVLLLGRDMHAPCYENKTRSQKLNLNNKCFQ